jgi:hypothetical protein
VTAALLVLLSLIQEPAGVTRQVFEVSGQVDRIDRAGRTITITSGGVVSSPIYAGPDLAIFNDLQSGDLVVVRYYDSYIVELKQFENDAARVLQQTRLVVTIDAIDLSTASVTYHGFDNRRVLRVVQDRKLLDGLKAGDVVTITYTRAQAVSIARPQ